MTFIQWLHDLINPTNLITETVYNVTFEIIATWIFVKMSLKKILSKKIKEELEKLKENQSDGSR